MFGSFCRSRTNDVICMMYEITAANTAMLSSAATICAPSSCCWRTQTRKNTAYPTTAPAISATCGVFRTPWVCDRNFGKYPARDSEYVFRPYAKMIVKKLATRPIMNSNPRSSVALFCPKIAYRPSSSGNPDAP